MGRLTQGLLGDEKALGRCFLGPSIKVSCVGKEFCTPGDIRSSGWDWTRNMAWSQEVLQFPGEGSCSY